MDIIFASLVFHCTLFLRLQGHNIYTRVAFEQITDQNYSTENDAFRVIKSETDIMCMRECSRRHTCMSFSYNSLDRVCRLHKNATGNRAAGNGWRHYLMKGISGCPLGWIKYANSCYHFEDVLIENWQTSLEICAEENAKLVDIETKEEQLFLVSIAESLLGFWTGGNDLDEEGVWRWRGTGHNISYTSWQDKEPNSKKGDEDCLIFAGEVGYNWRDFKCSNARNFICEKEIS